MPDSPSIEFHSLFVALGTPVPTLPLTGPRELGGLHRGHSMRGAGTVHRAPSGNQSREEQDRRAGLQTLSTLLGRRAEVAAQAGSGGSLPQHGEARDWILWIRM